MGEPNLPIGRVTFLLTDVEGSARLWDGPGVMADRCARLAPGLRQGS